DLPQHGVHRATILRRSVQVKASGGGACTEPQGRIASRSRDLLFAFLAEHEQVAVDQIRMCRSETVRKIVVLSFTVIVLICASPADVIARRERSARLRRRRVLETSRAALLPGRAARRRCTRRTARRDTGTSPSIRRACPRSVGPACAYTCSASHSNV